MEKKELTFGSSKTLPSLNKQELVKGFSTLLLLAFGVPCWGEGGGAVLCIVGCSTASLASIY